MHPFFILNDHDQVHSFHTDLQSPVSARNSNERRRAPAVRGAAGGYAFPSFTSEDKPAFDHVRHNGYALCVLQHFRNPLKPFVVFPIDCKASILIPSDTRSQRLLNWYSPCMISRCVEVTSVAKVNKKLW